MSDLNITAIAIASITGNARAHALDISFRLSDNSLCTVQTPLSVVANLAIGLQSEYAALAKVLPQQELQSVQPLRFRGANPLQGANGERALEIRLGIYQVVIVLAEAEAENLISALEQLFQKLPQSNPRLS